MGVSQGLMQGPFPIITKYHKTESQSKNVSNKTTSASS